MEKAFNEALTGMNSGHGGPFGAVIVKNGEIVSFAHNEVLHLNDPTAHAEIQAIRKASQILNNFNLEGCVFYSTSEPCPMCLAAIYWAGIRKIFYACNRFDAEKHGFADKMIYDEMQNGNPNTKMLKKQLNRTECLHLFDEWEVFDGKKMY